MEKMLTQVTLETGKENALARVFGKPTSNQLEKINQLAKRPLTDEEVFVFGSKFAGDMIIPNRYIQLHKSLLQVFKGDAQKGVAFMLDHPWAGFFTRPKPAYVYGRTFDATIRKGDAEGESWALYGDTYIVRNREKDGVSTNAIISDIEDGVLFDTSIGWGADNFECSICGNDIRNYSKCEHWPGRTYEVDDEQKLCYAIAKPPGYLMENSGVFDGAYPTAGILSQDGQIDGEGDIVAVQNLKQLDPGIPLLHAFSYTKGRLLTYARRADVEKKVVVTNQTEFSATPNAEVMAKGGEENMGQVSVNLVDTAGAVLHTFTWEPDAEMHISVDSLSAWIVPTVQEVPAASYMTKEQAIEVLGTEYDASQVLKFAKEGIDARKELIADTVAWGIRAEGNDFGKDAWEQILNEPGRTIEAIKAFRDKFKKQAEDAIAAGRITDPEAKKEGKKSGSNIPDSAYQG